jgi:hypothetical protein
MPERAVDDIGDFRHAQQDRGDPARGDCIELQAGVAGVQPSEQRLRHDGVADPGGATIRAFFMRSGGFRRR